MKIIMHYISILIPRDMIHYMDGFIIIDMGKWNIKNRDERY